MSLWTDRELKVLMAKVKELESRVEAMEDAATKPAPDLSNIPSYVTDAYKRSPGRPRKTP